MDVVRIVGELEISDFLLAPRKTTDLRDNDLLRTIKMSHKCTAFVIFSMNKRNKLEFSMGFGQLRTVLSLGISFNSIEPILHCTKRILENSSQFHFRATFETIHHVFESRSTKSVSPSQ